MICKISTHGRHYWEEICTAGNLAEAESMYLQRKAWQSCVWAPCIQVTQRSMDTGPSRWPGWLRSYHGVKLVLGLSRSGQRTYLLLNRQLSGQQGWDKKKLPCSTATLMTNIKAKSKVFSSVTGHLFKLNKGLRDHFLSGSKFHLFQSLLLFFNPEFLQVFLPPPDSNDSSFLVSCLSVFYGLRFSQCLRAPYWVFMGLTRCLPAYSVAGSTADISVL